jgi:peptide/nickel transport system ATP-binding protein
MLLEIENLKTQYRTSKGTVKAVDGVSFSIREREVFGLVGESGCGKSTLVRAVMRLLPSSSLVSAEKLTYKGTDLLSTPDKEFRERILWKQISLVPQSAMNSLNPVYRVGDQIIEAMEAHSDAERGINKKEASDRVEKLFDIVGLERNLLTSFPHEFSGGMRQRAMIAMALALEPSLIIMDEPTTGLDVLVQERILRRLTEIRNEIRASILLITHDISVFAQMSDRIGVMYAGRLMECADTLELFNEPYHPYTLGLKNAFPNIQAMNQSLISIPGSPPDLIDEIPGCIFEARCPFSIPDCREARPEEREVKKGHFAACIRTDHVEKFRIIAGDKNTWQSSKLIS